MLDSPLSSLIRTTKSRITALQARGINTLRDLLMYFPFRYADETEFGNIIDLNTQNAISVQGEFKNVKLIRTKRGKAMLTADFFDDESDVKCMWFNQIYLKNTIKLNQKYVVTGKIKISAGKKTLMSPRVELLKTESSLKHSGRLVPVYNEFEMINSKWLREKIHPLLHFSNLIEERLPLNIVDSFSLMPLSEAIRQVHFPDNDEALKNARFRLGFDEMLIISLGALKRKYDLKNYNYADSVSLVVEKEYVSEFRSFLPFNLTNAQEEALNDILSDLIRSEPMSRLVEGDVGSGKTVVAFMAMYMALKNKKQALLMAPTEILAKQHMENALKVFKNSNVNLALLSGSMTKKQKEEVKAKLKLGLIDMIFGTHAIIQDDVDFKDLGVSVIDEQHRFGVSQRAFIKRFGTSHMLSMTATPIPRTLALTLYGDQDLSIIGEKPAGRKEIITRLIPEAKRDDAYLWIKAQIDSGRQAFIVCPLVEDSDSIDKKSVVSEHIRLKEEVFPKLKIALLHGKMKQKEKDQLMLDFKDKKYDILVSTTVIEVGIDVPNSSIIVIEDADRFGLAQLHQLRGRVGRSSHQSYCFLFMSSNSHSSKERMKAMVNFSDGFKLSEIDLDLRGPGEVYGTRQSGIPDLKMASLTDSKLINIATKAAQMIMAQDPELESSEYLNFEVLKGQKEVDL